MAEPSLLCVNCARPPPAHRRTWNRCVRCAELNLPSTYYCGDECAQAHWPKHKVYHKEQKQWVERMREGAVLEYDRSLAKSEARDAERTGSEFDKRFAAALALMAEDDHHASAKAWRKIIKEWPHRPEPYFNLAAVLQRSNHNAESAPMLLKAMELFEENMLEGTEDWATAAALAFDRLSHPACREVPKPEWWNDEALKTLSARLLAVAPDKSESCAMRACVLGGTTGPLSGTTGPLSKAPWNAAPRTAAEIKEAATLYRRAAKVTGLPADKLMYAEAASRCDAFADPLLAKEEVEAAKARAAAEAEAAEALRVAEAKAAVAAEELLAEEEQEKQQVSTKAGKAKQSKGKKGQGKR